MPVGMHEKFLNTLPLNYDDTTLRTVEQIDVLWLKGRAMARPGGEAACAAQSDAAERNLTDPLPQVREMQHLSHMSDSIIAEYEEYAEV